MNKKLLNLGQWIGLAFLAFGCGYEIVYRAELGYIVITTGSLIFTVSTKLKYYRKKRRFH